MGARTESVIELFSAFLAILTTVMFGVAAYLLRDDFDGRCLLFADWTTFESLLTIRDFFGDAWICTAIAYGGFVVAGVGVVFLLHAIASAAIGKDILVDDTESPW